MSLERHTTRFNKESMERLMGQRVESMTDIAVLTDSTSGGNYFYGGTLTVDGTERTFVGQGPSHKIFEQMIRKITKKRGQICTCQININRQSLRVDSIVFLRDPGEGPRHIPVSTQDEKAKRRRTTRIRAMVSSLSVDVCERSIGIVLLSGETKRYIYWVNDNLLQEDVFLK